MVPPLFGGSGTPRKERPVPDDDSVTGLWKENAAVTATETIVSRRQPCYGDRELRYLKDYLDGLLEHSTARAPTRREAGFRAWLREGTTNWLREDLTGALTLEQPARPRTPTRNGKRPVQLPLTEDNGR